MQTRPNTDSFFVRQNIWLKLCILLMGSITALAIPVKGLFYLVIITFLYILLSPSILKSVLWGLRIFLPFMAGYSLFATVLGMSGETILIFLLRIILMIVLVTIFSASFRLKRFLEDSRLIQQIYVVKPMLFYAFATLIYMKHFACYYTHSVPDNKVKSFHVSRLVTKLLDAIHDNWLIRTQIQTETEALLQSDYQQSVFFTMTNVIGCMYLTLLILALSI